MYFPDVSLEVVETVEHEHLVFEAGDPLYRLVQPGRCSVVLVAVFVYHRRPYLNAELKPFGLGPRVHGGQR